nr:hypothetical protein [Tanacetum cinerariifolium]
MTAAFTSVANVVVEAPRPKRDEEFTAEENARVLADIQAAGILSQGLPRHIFNTLNQTESAKMMWGNIELLMKGSGLSEQHKQEELFDEYERFRAIGNESIYEYFIRFHKLANDLKSTKNKIPTHQQNIKFQTTFHRIGQSTKGNQGYRKKTYRNGKKVICYNCRGEGHMARKCKEPKRAKDTQYYKDKMMLSDAKDRGVILDAESEAFLADVECTEPYDESLALSTTTAFQVSHEDAYYSDVDDGPHAAAAFMANLSSTEEANGTSSSKINKVHSNASDSYNSDNNDNTMPYQQYLLLTETVVSPTKKPSETHYVSPGEIYQQDQITAILPQLEGHIKTNKDLSRANESLKAKLAQCKLEMQSLKRNKELSREQVYWQSASAVKALFIHTRPAKNAEISSSCIREHSKGLELEAEITKKNKMLSESEK